MKVIVNEKEISINKFAKMLENKEYWAKIPYRFKDIAFGAVLLFGKDNNGFYYINFLKEKKYIDLLKIPSVNLVKIIK